jgi:formate dehydrogenase major subunit
VRRSRTSTSTTALFSGYDPETGTYDTKSWAYAGHADDGSDDESEGSQKERAAGRSSAAAAPTWSRRRSSGDETLQHRRRCSRSSSGTTAGYTPELVQEVCGVRRRRS